MREDFKMTKEQKDKNFIIRALAEIQGVFQILEIQNTPNQASYDAYEALSRVEEILGSNPEAV